MGDPLNFSRAMWKENRENDEKMNGNSDKILYGLSVANSNAGAVCLICWRLMNARR